VAPDERESFLRIDKQVILDGIENINEESLTVRESQTLIISTRKSRFVDTKGNKFLVGVIRDITNSKKAELALKASECQLKELNATKDKLFSIIGHDLKSPFQNILGLSELMNKSIDTSNKVDSQEYLNLITSTTKNTLTLLENLLNWAKSQTGQVYYKSEKINLSKLIEEALSQSNPIAKSKGISLNQHLSCEIDFFSDEKILVTILRNLLSNAIKFTKPGGEITVSVLSNDNSVEFSIADNGIGINEEMCEHLFTISSNMSTRGTANERGSGFGLILCKEFVEKLGGNIWVESVERKGSNFKFTLPLGKAS
jgi:signal transduction histidine kinase